MMAADGMKAHGILLGFAPLSLFGYCWYYVWRAYAAAGAVTSMGSTPTAYAAWNVTKGRHPGDRNPPPGAAIWLGRRHSDGNMDGDVFIAGPADGQHAATDQPTWGATGLTSIQGRMDLTGREYLGWSDHVLDCPITLGGNVPPAPLEDITDMCIFVFNIAIDNVTAGTWVLVLPQGTGKPAAIVLDGKSLASNPDVPVFQFSEEFSARAAVNAVSWS